MARPTKYKPEMCQAIIDAMSKGYSKEAAAHEIGIAKDTFYAWDKKHKEFSDAIKEGEKASRHFWEKLGIAGAMGKVPGFNATSWIFNMKNRHGWADKKEISGKDGADIILKITKDDESVL